MNRLFRRDLAVALGLFSVTLLVYARTLGATFISLDDPPYIVSNPYLREGSLLRNLKWMILSFDPDNWFPVTRLSLFLDYKLWGLNAALIHAENVLLHALASVLLYGFLVCATHHRRPSVFAAFLFALHPLHVESVAWVAERKDVLCAVFWFASLWAWVAHRRGVALVLFCLGLMSKPMIVSLPFLLLLLDIWPLRRQWSRRLILEKVPFFAASIAVMAVTIVAQRAASAVQSLDMFPPGLRAANALASIALYLRDTVWPLRLWMPHLFPDAVPLWPMIAGVIAVTSLSALCWHQRQRRPWLLVGGLWFLISLAPVLGLVQVGGQARADRYMYVPMVGLSLMLAWSVRKVSSVVPAAVGLVLAGLTFAQTAHWRDTEAVFRHAVTLDPGNLRAWTLLAGSMVENPARQEEALAAFRRAVDLSPRTDWVHSNLGNALVTAGRPQEAIPEFEHALRLNPQAATTRVNLGEVLVRTGRREEALAQFEAAVRTNPRLVAALNDLGTMLFSVPDRSQEGLAYLERAVAADPYHAQARTNLAHALVALGRVEEAAELLQR